MKKKLRLMWKGATFKQGTFVKKGTKTLLAIHKMSLVLQPKNYEHWLDKSITSSLNTFHI